MFAAAIFAIAVRLTPQQMEMFNAALVFVQGIDPTLDEFMLCLVDHA